MLPDHLNIYARHKVIKKLHDKVFNEIREILTNDTAKTYKNISKSEIIRKLKEFLDALKNIPFQILHSSEITKINEHKKCQTRILVISNLAILNVKKSSFKIQRIIPFPKINYITLSNFVNQKKESEFIIHVKDGYDYLFQSSFAKEIVEIIQNHSLKILKEGNPSIFLKGSLKMNKIEIEKKNNASLENFVVTKADLKEILKYQKIASRNVLGIEKNDLGKISHERKIEDLIDGEEGRDFKNSFNNNLLNENFNNHNKNENRNEEKGKNKVIKSKEKEETPEKELFFNDLDLQEAHSKLKKVQTNFKINESKKKDSIPFEELESHFGKQSLGEIKDLKTMILEAKSKLQKPPKIESESSDEESKNEGIQKSVENLLAQRLEEVNEIDKEKENENSKESKEFKEYEDYDYENFDNYRNGGEVDGDMSEEDSNYETVTQK